MIAWLKMKLGPRSRPRATDRRVDALEAAMREQPQLECPVRHIFTPGLYARECHLAKGMLLTSKIHKTEHPFVISQGEISVWTEDQGIVRYRAPYSGVTKPGTRRVLYVHEDTIWTTFHPTKETDVARIEAQIIERREAHATIDQRGIPWLG